MSKRLTQLVFLGSLGVLLVLLATSLFTIHRTLILRETMLQLTDGTMLHTRIVDDFNVSAHRVIIEAQSIMLSGRESEFEEIDEAFAKSRQASDTLGAMRLPNFGDTTLAQRYEDLDVQRQSLLVLLQQMIVSVKADTQVGTGQSDEMFDLVEQGEDLLSEVEEQSDETLTYEQDIACDLAKRMVLEVLVSVVVSLLLLLATAIGTYMLLRRAVVHPLVALTQALRAFTDRQRAEPIAVTSKTEIGDLQRTFNQMVQVIDTQQGDLRAQVDLAEQARLRAEQAQRDLSAQMLLVEEQRTVIREMSVPVLPVSESILVMPLVGAIDAERMNTMQRQALRSIQEYRATKLLIDITGIPLIDSQVGQGIIQIIRAGRVLGADIILIGVRPEVAQAIVMLGVDLPTLHTARDLRTVLQL